jgi:hypothetical protein
LFFVHGHDIAKHGIVATQVINPSVVDRAILQRNALVFGRKEWPVKAALVLVRSDGEQYDEENPNGENPGVSHVHRSRFQERTTGCRAISEIGAVNRAADRAELILSFLGRCLLPAYL